MPAKTESGLTRGPLTSAKTSASGIGNSDWRHSVRFCSDNFCRSVRTLLPDLLEPSRMNSRTDPFRFARTSAIVYDPRVRGPRKAATNETSPKNQRLHRRTRFGALVVVKQPRVRGEPNRYPTENIEQSYASDRSWICGRFMRVSTASGAATSRLAPCDAIPLSERWSAAC